MSRASAPALNTRLLPLVMLAFVSTMQLAQPANAAAQSRAETDAASQALDTDPDLAAWDLAVTTNVIAPFFGSYGARLEIAPLRWLSLLASPSWLTTPDGGGLRLELGARLWPQRLGLDGLFVGPSITATRLDVNGATSVGLGIVAEAGWQIVWGGLALALSGEVGWATQTDGAEAAWVLGARLGLGWAWR